MWELTFIYFFLKLDFLIVHPVIVVHREFFLQFIGPAISANANYAAEVFFDLNVIQL
jgi:hypothetical protein